MRYYGRGWYPRRQRWYSRITTKSAPATSSPYWKSLQFVRTKFFCLDPHTFERFTDFYGQKHGSGAKQYLRRTYSSWKSGATNTSGQTEHRILACVPPFLDKGKQFELLSFQIPAVVQQQKAELKAPSIRTSTLEPTYRGLANSIGEREYKLDWFVKDVFGAEELSEFVNVFKYTMLDCLRQSFAQVREDLIIMHDLLPTLDGSVDLSYQIALLSCPLEVDVYPAPGAARLDIPMSEPRLVTQFQDRYRAILLEHALAQCRAEVVGQTNRQVALADIQTVVRQLQRTTSDQEYDSTLEVQGHGGTLRVRLQKKNLLRLRYTIAKQTFKLLLVVAITAAIVVWLCTKRFWPIMIYLGIIPLGVIGSIWRTLTELKSEVTEYERKRTTRFTTP